MKGIKRHYINIDKQKLQELHPEVDDQQFKCMMSKWNPFRDKWKQGFDSDCYGHCTGFESCLEAFHDDRVEGKNHLKQIIVPMEEKPCWEDKQVEIKDID
jgi:hypothetical protein